MGLGDKARRAHTQESKQPISHAENRGAYGHGSNVLRGTHVAHDGRIHQSQEGNGYVRHHRGQGKTKNLGIKS